MKQPIHIFPLYVAALFFITRSSTSRGKTVMWMLITLIEHVMTHQPQDFIVKANALQFSGNGGLSVALNDAEFGVHRFALGQIAESASLPVKFLDSLTGSDWGRALIAHNLTEVFKHRDAKRHLVRTLNGEVRGFLSDSYRRLDSRPIIEAFVAGVQKLGALPYKGIVTDTRVAIQAILPDVFEAIPGEVIAFVLSLENSDFGNGAGIQLQPRMGVHCLRHSLGHAMLKSGASLPECQRALRHRSLSSTSYYLEADSADVDSGAGEGDLWPSRTASGSGLSR